MILLHCAVCVITEKRDEVMFRRIVAFTLTFVHIVLCCLPICQAESLSDTVVEKRLCNATMEDEFEEDSVIVVLT